MRSPRAGTSNKGGVDKVSSYLYMPEYLETVADTAKVTIND